MPVSIIRFEEGPGNKKYTAILSNGKTVHFGDRRYEQYKDQTGRGLWSHKNHLDTKRRADYRKRHKAQTDAQGVPYYQKRFTPAWFSWHFLW